MSVFMDRIPVDQSLTLEEAIQNGGYEDIYKNWNSLIVLDEYPGYIFRERVEVFIFNKKGSIYAELYPDKNYYRLPGGSTTKNKSYKYQVAEESKQEARILVGKIEDTNYSYVKFYKNKYKCGNMRWEGTLNRVFVTEFKRWYDGFVPKTDFDYSMYKYGRFIPFEYMVNILTDDHRKALKI